MVKQIIKRIIVGVSVALILSLIYKNVNAEEYGNITAINLQTTFNQAQIKMEGLRGASDFDETNLASGNLSNYGKGFIIFSFAYYSDKTSGTLYSTVINSVSIKSGSALYACEIGNLEPYTDSGVQYKQATAKCYVNLGSNGFERIRFQVPYQPSNGITFILISRYATFVGASTPQSNQNVVNAIQQQTQQQQTIISQNEQIIQQQTQTNNNLNDIKDSLTDDTPPSQSDVSNVIDNKVQGNTTIAETITAIPNMLGIFGTTISGTCSSPYNFGRLYNTDITFNCIDPSRYLGSTIWSIVDVIFCIAVIVPFSRWIINAWNRFTSLKEVLF